jgi:hypothetical protein
VAASIIDTYYPGARRTSVQESTAYASGTLGIRRLRLFGPVGQLDLLVDGEGQNGGIGGQGKGEVYEHEGNKSDRVILASMSCDGAQSDEQGVGGDAAGRQEAYQQARSSFRSEAPPKRNHSSTLL